VDRVKSRIAVVAAAAVGEHPGRVFAALAADRAFTLIAVLQLALETAPRLRVHEEARMAARAEVRSSFAGETDCSVALPAEFDAAEGHLVQSETRGTGGDAGVAQVFSDPLAVGAVGAVRAGFFAGEAVGVAPVALAVSEVVVALDALVAHEAVVRLVDRQLEGFEAARAVPGRLFAGSALRVALPALALVLDVALHAAVGAVARGEGQQQRRFTGETEGRVELAGLAVRTALVALVVGCRNEVARSAETAGAVCSRNEAIRIFAGGAVVRQSAARFAGGAAGVALAVGESQEVAVAADCAGVSEHCGDHEACCARGAGVGLQLAGLAGAVALATEAVWSDGEAWSAGRAGAVRFGDGPVRATRGAVGGRLAAGSAVGVALVAAAVLRGEVARTADSAGRVGGGRRRPCVAAGAEACVDDAASAARLAHLQTPRRTHEVPLVDSLLAAAVRGDQVAL